MQPKNIINQHFFSRFNIIKMSKKKDLNLDDVPNLLDYEWKIN